MPKDMGVCDEVEDKVEERKVEFDGEMDEMVELELLRGDEELVGGDGLGVPGGRRVELADAEVSENGGRI